MPAPSMIIVNADSLHVHYFCDLNYDVIRFIRDNNSKYGLNINIFDDAKSLPSLWSRISCFIAANTQLVHTEADLNWLLDPQCGEEYNNCHFFSNFEIDSLDFWRSAAIEEYFKWFDRNGGVFFEKLWKCTGVHTERFDVLAKKRNLGLVVFETSAVNMI